MQDPTEHGAISKATAQPDQLDLGDRVIIRLSRYQIEATGNLNNGTEWAAADITRVYGPKNVNLRVICDGPTTLWVQNSERGFAPGQWHDPRVERPPSPRRSGSTLPIPANTSLVR